MLNDYHENLSIRTMIEVVSQSDVTEKYSASWLFQKEIPPFLETSKKKLLLCFVLMSMHVFS